MRKRTSTHDETPETVPAPTPEPVVGEGARPARRRTSAVGGDLAVRAAEVLASRKEPEAAPDTSVESSETTAAPSTPDAVTDPAQQQGYAYAANSDDLRMTCGFDVIVETAFRFDAEAAYERIRRAIDRGKRASRQDYGSLVMELDEASEVSREALQLVANAVVTREAFEIEAKVIESELRQRAAEDLKKTGTKETIQAIEDRMNTKFHDEVRSLTDKRARARQTVIYIEGLAKVAHERQRDLRQMVASASKV